MFYSVSYHLTMSADVNFIAELIRTSFVELKDVISTCTESKDEAEAMSQKAERIVVAMIAMVNHQECLQLDTDAKRPGN